MMLSHSHRVDKVEMKGQTSECPHFVLRHCDREPKITRGDVCSLLGFMFVDFMVLRNKRRMFLLDETLLKHERGERKEINTQMLPTRLYILCWSTQRDKLLKIKKKDI